MAEAGFPRAFFLRPTDQVARDLLGARLETVLPDGRTGGTIVETEAYLGPEDGASHAAFLRAGLAAMRRPGGHLYVYRSYGVHAMLNIVTGDPTQPGAVLVRALDPDTGIDLMRQRRGLRDERSLCSGPGKLCQALGITLADDGLDLCAPGPVSLFDAGNRPAVATSTRIGITKATDLPLRFFVPGNPHLSGPRSLNRTRP